MCCLGPVGESTPMGHPDPEKSKVECQRNYSATIHLPVDNKIIIVTQNPPIMLKMKLLLYGIESRATGR